MVRVLLITDTNTSFVTTLANRLTKGFNRAKAVDIQFNFVSISKKKSLKNFLKKKKHFTFLRHFPLFLKLFHALLSECQQQAFTYEVRSQHLPGAQPGTRISEVCGYPEEGAVREQAQCQAALVPVGSKNTPERTALPRKGRRTRLCHYRRL